MEREEFEKIIEELMIKAKGNNNSIDMGEVQTAVKDLSLTEEQMENFLLLLENKGVEVTPVLDEDTLKSWKRETKKKTVKTSFWAWKMMISLRMKKVKKLISMR